MKTKQQLFEEVLSEGLFSRGLGNAEKKEIAEEGLAKINELISFLGDRLDTEVTDDLGIARDRLVELIEYFT
jgi:hypothetical protein